MLVRLTAHPSSSRVPTWWVLLPVVMLTHQLQALFSIIAEEGGAPGLLPRGRMGDYVMTEGA